MDNFIIYEHISPSNKIYVGITCQNPNIRWGYKGANYLHKVQDKYKQPLFANAINKYGWNNFQHIIIASNLGPQTAKNMEKDLIAFNKAKGESYNLADGGDGHFGYIMSEERKLQQSIDRKGKALSQQWKEHVVEALQNNRDSIAKKHRKPVVQLSIDGEYLNTYASGKEASQHTGVDASFIAGCCRGKYRTAGNFIWLYLQDYALNKEQLISQHQNMPTIGTYNRSAEQRQKISERSKQKKVPYMQLLEANKKAQEVLSKQVLQISESGIIIAVYKSASEAAKIIGADNSFISKCCRNNCKGKGYYWKYNNKQQEDSI